MKTFIIVMLIYHALSTVVRVLNLALGIWGNNRKEPNIVVYMLETMLGSWVVFWAICVLKN